MASRSLPGLSLDGFWNLGEDGWKTGADANWQKLSALVQLSVLSRTTALPGSPSNGMIYIVPAGAASNANSIAVRDNGGWVYFAPTEGWRAWVRDTDTVVTFDGTSWIDTSTKTGFFSLFAGGLMQNGEILATHSVAATFTVPAGATGSTAAAETPATATATLTISKATGGTSADVGTIQFTAGSLSGTFTFGSAVTFNSGDRIIIKAPSTADSTLADVSVTLKGVVA